MTDQPAPAETVEAPAEEMNGDAPEAAAPLPARRPDRTPLSERDPVGLANHFAASGYFKDAGDLSKAVVKMVAGEELGIPRMASMQSIFFLDGKLTLSANLVATLVKRSDYDYRVGEHNETKCSIAFLDAEGNEFGVSTFTIEDAKTAGLVRDKSGWKRYPKAMLFARAMTQGVRWFCPDVMLGVPAYTPEEVGAEVDEYGVPRERSRDGLPGGESHDESPSEADLIAALDLPEALKASLTSSAARANELSPNSWGVAKLAMRLQNRTLADARQVLVEIEDEISKAEARIAKEAEEAEAIQDAEVVEDEPPAEPESEDPRTEEIEAAALELHDRLLRKDGEVHEIEGMTKAATVVRVRLSGISKTINFDVDEKVTRVLVPAE